MANSEYEYVKREFEFDRCLPPSNWIVVRIDGCHFHRFSKIHAFEKPNDENALRLMNACATAVLEKFPDIVFAYGVSDEYRGTEFYHRRESKILSLCVSYFTSVYVMKWKDFFPDKELKEPPYFDARAVCYPNLKTIRDYLAWRQVDCHINNQYNTCFWMLVKSGKSEQEAQIALKGTFAKDKNELLAQQFQINYDDEPAMFRKGSSVYREKPNDGTALRLMNESASLMMEQYPDIVFAYGFSNEYSFVFHEKRIRPLPVMGLSRRFLNLIVDKRTNPGAKSLCCMDLNLRRHSLFLDTATPPPVLRNKTTTRTRAPKRNAAAVAFNKIQLPTPSFNVRASDSDQTDQRIHFLPAAADQRVFCLDQSGRGFILEANTPRVVMMPLLHRPKPDPISLNVPYTEPDFDDLDGGGGGNLFIMDRRVAKPEPQGSGGGFQFEALVYRKPHSSSWHRELVPPPPTYVLGGAGDSCLEISSYAIVKAGSQICVSVDGNGTYCLDAASNTGTTDWTGMVATYCEDDAWSEVGKWTLPFRGEVRYVPELKLWFGFTADAEDQCCLLAAADLSAMDSQSQPQVHDSWKELETPKGWLEVQDPQLVSLGSRRFCIARFFRTAMDDCQNVTVLTGVEVVRGVNFYPGNVGDLRMVKHKSLCHKSGCGEDTITAVF
ncbi:hypothetical protein BDA96_09G260500 [Sorghum bicolor]|uniref:tRNA(His) guanylyltransferase n=1 Tax=Sorghum bicolor TaxID=4558 RepID=A0A921QE11_SORBI|nr:hypothetical protein BDA96_09G260500 [Sorghum bicolor]